MQPSSAARHRSTGESDALAVSTLRRQISQPLHVMELDGAEITARTHEPAPEHAPLERGRRATQERALETKRRVTATASPR